MLEASHMAHTFAQMLACSNIITSGVLERFPRLRIAFLEAGAGWVPYWMHRMDEYNEVAPERWAHISAKPSQYIKSGRVFFSCEPGDEFIPFFLEHVGEDAMLFASDYLHFDALFVGEKRGEGEPYPGTVATLLARKDVPDSAKRKMLLDNSLNFYRMDRSTLGKRGMAPVRPEPAEARQAVMPGTISARLYRLAGAPARSGSAGSMRGDHSLPAAACAPCLCRWTLTAAADCRAYSFADTLRPSSLGLMIP